MDTPTTVKRPHPAARLFSEEARRAVAEGPLFERQRGLPMTPRRPDGCCLIGALLLAEFPEFVNVNPELKMPGFWSLTMALEQQGRALSEWREIHLMRLMDRNDRGEYADRATLRRDLLGEVQP